MEYNLPKLKRIVGIAVVALVVIFVLGFALKGMNPIHPLPYVGSTKGGVMGIPSPGIEPMQRDGSFYDIAEDSYAPSKGRSASSPSVPNVVDRKVVTTGSLSLLVNKADAAAKEIENIARKMGGFVSDSNIYEISSGVKTGTITIRVPAAKFSEAVSAIKAFVVKVEREQSNASDVTEQFVDLEARLKNLRAEEEQYREIMKRAVKVEETLQVAQRLSDVRGRIEQIEGQLKYLSNQVDMSSITASLTEEADIEVFGIRWRPLYVAKQAFRNLLTGLTGWVDAMVKFLLYIPVAALWIGTFVVIVAIVWKIARWIWRKFFAPVS